jgi:hypothetical protein
LVKYLDDKFNTFEQKINEFLRGPKFPKDLELYDKNTLLYTGVDILKARDFKLRRATLKRVDAEEGC